MKWSLFASWFLSHTLNKSPWELSHKNLKWYFFISILSEYLNQNPEKNIEWDLYCERMFFEKCFDTSDSENPVLILTIVLLSVCRETRRALAWKSKRWKAASLNPNNGPLKRGASQQLPIGLQTWVVVHLWKGWTERFHVKMNLCFYVATFLFQAVTFHNRSKSADCERSFFFLPHFPHFWWLLSQTAEKSHNSQWFRWEAVKGMQLPQR